MKVQPNLEKMLFLLGGHDLEMLTIRDILDEQGVNYVDHQLQWHNAFVSSYQKEIEEIFNNGWTVWGIELQEDMVVPSYYKSIDHHNDLAHLPSALEQVLAILQLPMNRYLQLVAANDKAYIPGMLQQRATAEEIDEIRHADRKLQGVTDEDECLAEKSITENYEKIGNLLVIRALTSRFSPICDRLFPYQCLLVYTDSEWMYYGKGAMQVRKYFENDYLAGKLFCGGGEDGYVGIKRGVYTSGELQQMIEQIKKTAK